MKETLIKHTPIFDLVEKQDNGTIGFNPVGVNAPDWITMIVEKGGKFLVVKQLRYGLMKECEEFVAGQVEPNEDPKVTAVRELAEETGIKVDITDVCYLGKLAANPAFMSNHMHYFYVNLDVTEYDEGKTSFDEHEKITHYWKDKKAVVADYMQAHTSVFMAGAFFLMQKNEFEI